MDRTFLLIGAIFGFLGVGFGAFGAHALRSRLSPEMLAVFETGVRYQMYHTFAVVIVAAAIGHIGNACLLVIAGSIFVAGIVLFSGSLYTHPSCRFASVHQRRRTPDRIHSASGTETDPSADGISWTQLARHFSGWAFTSFETGTRRVSDVHGTLDRTLGRRYAGCGYGWLQ